jgi:hypothetical protein
LEAFRPRSAPISPPGGLGILIGDGALNCRTEKVFETYYSYSLSSWSSVTFDYQLIAEPAYNADRGPVHVFSVRLHTQFLTATPRIAPRDIVVAKRPLFPAIGARGCRNYLW